MASFDCREDSVALVVPNENLLSTPALVFAKSHVRDVRMLSFAFFFIFAAYSAAQNLESTLNSDLGSRSVGLIYVSFMLSSLVAAPVIGWLGSKRALLLGSSGYFLFIAANLKPSWYTMVPASLYLGFSASILWVGQGTYLTSAAQSHARECNLDEGSVIGAFNGEFWGIYSSNQLIGNLISLALLREEKGRESIGGQRILFLVFLGCVVVGITLLWFLSKRDESTGSVCGTCEKFHIGSVLRSITALLCDARMLLIIPLIVYIGFQKAYVWAEFTKNFVKPVLGISGVGGAMALYGVVSAICAVSVGRFTSGLFSIALFVSASSLLELIALLWLFFCYSSTGEGINHAYPLVIASLWGIGEGALNTQINALLGMFFKHDKVAAFAQLWVWQSAAVASIYFMSSQVNSQVMFLVMIGALCVSLCCFFALVILIRRSYTVSSGII